MWIWVGALVVAAVVGAAAVWVVYADEGALAQAGVLLGLVALAGPILLWLHRRLRVTRSEAVGLSQVADELAVSLTAQWERAAVERGLRTPARVPVRWRWTSRAVTGPVSDAAGTTATSTPMTPLPGVDQTNEDALRHGEVRDLFGIYAGLASGRMVLLGPPGSGKSAAAVLLMLDALAHRAGLPDADRGRTPVPVLMTAHGWDPETQPITDWLANRLGQDHPQLGGGTAGRKAALQLVNQGHVALVLDGLDEMPAPVRATAVQALNEQVTYRLVVLTRTREMVDAVKRGHLAAAAAFELQSVSNSDAADYLSRCRPSPPPQQWAALVRHLRKRPTSPITQALSTPLMLALVRDTFPDPADVESVLLGGGFTSRQQVEDALLDRVIPAAYSPRPGQPPPRYTADQAQRWLGRIAASMNADETRDLAWWELRYWQPEGPRMMMPALAFGIMFLLLFQGSLHLAPMLSLGLSLAL